MRIAIVASFAVVNAGAARAQSVRLADSLLRAGHLARAESLYYAATRNRPSDPVARKALGDFLVARGAPRVGATLLEEAIRFGGDRAAIERDLEPVYLSMEDYHLLAALMSTPPADRDRAKWLIAHETRTIAPDSMVSIAFHGSPDTSVIGHLQLRVDGRTLDATVSTRARGLVISEGAVSPLHLHVFPGPSSGSHGSGILAAADSVSIGALSMRNVPVSIARLDGNETAAVGIDMLGRFAPTFDARTQRVTLRASGSVTTAAGDTLETLQHGAEVEVLRDGAWSPLGSESIMNSLRDHRWTFDAKHGRIVVER